MALRDQPYLPLYIQDIMTDEKLNECCAATHGVYIKGIMCLMHKSEIYGKILLKQKYRQTGSKEHNFALMLANHLPYAVDVIFAAILELIEEDVCQFEGDYLVQKRMVSDGELSIKRSLSGKKGGVETQKKNKKLAKAKSKPNAEYEYEILSIIKSLEEIQGVAENSFEQKKLMVVVVVKMVEIFMKKNPLYFFQQKDDYSACLQIAYKISEMKKWNSQEVLNGKMDETLLIWDKVADFIKNDTWLCTRSLTDISNTKEWQRLIQKMTAAKSELKKEKENIAPKKDTDEMMNKYLNK